MMIYPDNGIYEGGFFSENMIDIVLEIGGQVVSIPQQAIMQEDVPHDANRMIVLDILHGLSHNLHGIGDIGQIEFSLDGIDVTELVGANVYLGKIFDESVIIEVVMIKIIRIIHDIILTKLEQVGLVTLHKEGYDIQHDDESNHEYYAAVVVIEEE